MEQTHTVEQKLIYQHFTASDTTSLDILAAYLYISIHSYINIWFKILNAKLLGAVAGNRL